MGTPHSGQAIAGSRDASSFFTTVGNGNRDYYNSGSAAPDIGSAGPSTTAGLIWWNMVFLLAHSFSLGLMSRVGRFSTKMSLLK